MGAELRDHRRPPPGLARVQADVQRTVDAGEVRLSESSPSATRFRRAGRGRAEVITFKPLSKNPGALQPAMCKKLGISEQTYYRWRKEYGGLRLDQAKRLKELERENTRLKRLVADQALDNSILKEVASGNF